jgi:hypothetical protein
MYRQSVTYLLIFASLQLLAQQNPTYIPFVQDSNTTATYQETIAFYDTLATASPMLKLEAQGSTDSGHPLHLAILSKGGTFDPITARQQGKLILFVNNAIHPGEPCGVDASMLLYRDLIEEKNKHHLLDRLVIVTIPFYNIGGGLNRSSNHRANQIGPHEHGFRGNAKNLDLNRDFIKCDSRNAQTFNKIFTHWQPDIFIDNHTSNGADYQYTMTLIATQADKLDQHLARYMERQMIPELYKKMKDSGWEMTPYVNVRSTPDEGIAGFLDLPRYASGYAALHNAISFIPETHMLKPFKDRVMSTYAFMYAMIETMHKDYNELKKARANAQRNSMSKDSFALNWTLDFEQESKLLFKGYEAKYKPSKVSGLDRLYYDRDAPYEKEVPFYNDYKTTLKANKPIAYIIPQAYHRVIERLKWNGVEVKQLARDTTIPVSLYRIKKHETVKNPYEGHYLHYNVEIEEEMKNWTFHEGDYIVYVNQPINRYIVETLEPQAPDSFFAWNFFDGILMQKEYFSSYVFEDLAAEMLKKDEELRKALESKRNEDEDFAKNARAQLNFIYQRSPYYEPTFQLYPVGRIIKSVDLPVGEE